MTQQMKCRQHTCLAAILAAHDEYGGRSMLSTTGKAAVMRTADTNN